jgi:hypothetical protein
MTERELFAQISLPKKLKCWWLTSRYNVAFYEKSLTIASCQTTNILSATDSRDVDSLFSRSPPQLRDGHSWDERRAKFNGFAENAHLATTRSTRASPYRAG